MRLACLCATALFSLFSYWQLNDLEQYGNSLWLGWVLLYAATAGLSLISAYRLLPLSLYWSAAGLAAVGALLRISAIEFDVSIIHNPSNPAGNEAGGLLVVSAWLFFLGLRRKTSRAS